MGSTVALCMQMLETQGWVVIRQNLSPRLLTSLARGFPNPNPSELVLVRQVFDGLPMRIIQGLIGEVMLSAIKYGAQQGWHRGRNDTVSSGAPANFIPGFDLAAILDSESCSVDVIAGSGRLETGEDYPVEISQSIEIAPGDLAIFDSRLLRRWPSDRCQWVYSSSVIRPWITPLSDFSSRIGLDMPPRALRFYGVPWQPARDVGEWLFRNHTKRRD